MRHIYHDYVSIRRNASQSLIVRRQQCLWMTSRASVGSCRFVRPHPRIFEMQLTSKPFRLHKIAPLNIYALCCSNGAPSNLLY
jgi:hypothetical protein